MGRGITVTFTPRSKWEKKMNKELNEKLTKWANAKEYFTDEDGCRQRKLIYFTESLDACFKWLVPKLWSMGLKVHIALLASTRQQAKITDAFGHHEDILVIDKDPALALCKALEKLVDEENK